MKIKEIRDSDLENYEGLALNYGSIFNSSKWLSIFDNLSILLNRK